MITASKPFLKIALGVVLLSLLTPMANAESDPFPGVANGAEIPGTRVSSPAGMSESDFYASSAYLAHTCPSGSGRGIGVDLAFTTDRSKHVRYVYCVKTWRSTETIDAEAKYQADLAAAQAAALAQSQAWNAANPGQQKCFQWGPITSPSGGTSSGGVCANPVGTAPSSSGSSSETSTVSAPSSSGSSGSSSSGGSSGSAGSGGSTSSSTDSATVTIPPSSGVAEVVTVAGQGDCPGGNDGWRRNLEVNATTGRTVTHCVRIETVVVATSSTTTTTVTRVVGADPYPNLATGAEIPGTRTWSTSETSWAQFATNSMRSGWACPILYGPNGDPYAAENNGFDAATGKWFRVCVKNPWREVTPIVRSTTSASDTGTVTTQSDTRTVTTQSDTRTVTTQSSSETVTAQSETRTAAIAAVAAIANTESRTVTAANLLNSFSAEEKESLMVVNRISSKSAVIKIATDIPQVSLVLTAVKKNAATVTFRVKTNNDGDAQIKTNRNLAGYTVTLIAGKIKLDSDLVKK